jgi:UDP-sulfoquinovose synthase
MKILILGGDGYLGWPTAMHFSNKGHDVAILDSMVKKYWEAEIGVEPLIPIRPLHMRVKKWNEVSGKTIKTYIGDISENHRFIYKVLNEFKPDAIIHYAEQPSAPFSMMDREKCVETQRNNVIGTLNLMFAIQSTGLDIHMVKLGTMGEYGTPNIDIEEGWLELEHNNRRDRVLFPKKPNSFYHLSKVHDSANLEFACRIWNMRVTDLNQGAVYGICTNETVMDKDLETSFHYDSIFGTVLNRFIVQAVNKTPLTVYGKGGQTRGFLNIIDTLKCVELAVINPAEPGEFRVFNQFTEQFSIEQLADKVLKSGNLKGLNVHINHIKNPRKEEEDHYYKATNTALPDLGLKPTLLTNEVLSSMIDTVEKYKKRIDESVILPKVKWKQ